MTAKTARGPEPAPDLSARVGVVELANPVMLASGTCGTGPELARAADASRVGAIVMKTVTREPREGNPPVRVAETASGMLNAIGLENPGIERFCGHYLPKARTLGVPLAASIAGRSPDDYVECAKALDAAGGVVALEVNLSCPNDREAGEGRTPLAFGQDPAAAAEVVAAVRSTTKLPVWAKLTSAVADIGALARACAEAGADAVTAINTIPGMAVDVRARRPVLSAVTGGLSGPAILPVALRCVREISRALAALDARRVSVIGCGGVSSAEDAVAMLLAGASAVQVGTATFRDPRAAVRMVEGLAPLVAEMGAASVGELVGALET
ncbi:MAG: dihydroorotate dehydrogenase [Planctomycetota bacterium]